MRQTFVLGIAWNSGLRKSCPFSTCSAFVEAPRAGSAKKRVPELHALVFVPLMVTFDIFQWKVYDACVCSVSSAPSAPPTPERRFLLSRFPALPGSRHASRFPDLALPVPGSLSLPAFSAPPFPASPAPPPPFPAPLAASAFRAASPARAATVSAAAASATGPARATRHWAARRGRERCEPSIGGLRSPLRSSPNARQPCSGLAARSKARPPLAPRGRRVPQAGERPRGPSGGRRPGREGLRCGRAAGSSGGPWAPEVGAGREGRPAAGRAGGAAACARRALPFPPSRAEAAGRGRAGGRGPGHAESGLCEASWLRASERGRESCRGQGYRADCFALRQTPRCEEALAPWARSHRWLSGGKGTNRGGARPGPCPV